MTAPMVTAETLDADRCWREVLARSREADGRFVYAVRSTGIYCRPSCPSRRAGREQVLFFPLPESAAAAGFRPCRRCRPQEAPADVEVVKRLCRFIEERLDEELDLATLSAHVELSPAHLQRLFKQRVGVTPRQYVAACRVGRLKRELKSSETVASAIFDAGYGSASRVYGGAAGQLGMTPGSYRGGAAGLRIRYSTGRCALGRLLVAATERGVCAVSLGDTDTELEAGLAREYPKARLERDDIGLGPSIEALLAHLEGHQERADLPLDVQATAFQWRVWNELKRIPLGCTRSYGEVAREIGQPGAARAVARACATNRTALVIPCHRVVRTDGCLADYRWGAARKQALLEAEKQGRGDE